MYNFEFLNPLRLLKHAVSEGNGIDPYCFGCSLFSRVQHFPSWMKHETARRTPEAKFIRARILILYQCRSQRDQCKHCTRDCTSPFYGDRSLKRWAELFLLSGFLSTLLSFSGLVLVAGGRLGSLLSKRRLGVPRLANNAALLDVIFFL